MDRLIELYKKSNGGNSILSEDDFNEYATLRKAEFTNVRDKLLLKGKKNVLPVKDDSGDILGWTFEDELIEGV